MSPTKPTPALLSMRVARSGLPAAERLALTTLLERLDRDGSWSVHATWPDIARRSCICVRTLRRAAAQLESLGLLSVQVGPTTTGRVTIWTIEPDAVAAIPKRVRVDADSHRPHGQIAPTPLVQESTDPRAKCHRPHGQIAPTPVQESTDPTRYIRARPDPFSDPSPDPFSDPSRTGPPAPTDAPAREGGTDGPAGKVLWAIERKLQNGRLVPKQAQQILTLVEGSPGLMERLTEAADAEDAITSPVGFVRSFIARGGVPSRRRTRSDEHPSEDDMEAQMERFNARRARS